MGLFNWNKKAGSPQNNTEGLRSWFKHNFTWLGDGQTLYNEASDDKYVDSYRTNANIYSIINLISRNAQIIPIKVYSIKSKSQVKDYTAMTSGFISPESITQAKIIKASTFREVENSPILKVLANPNPMETWSSFIANYIGFGKLTGNRYIYGVRDGGQKIKEMYMMPSQNMEIVSGGWMNPVKGYSVDFSNDGNSVDFTPDEICHIKDFNPNFDGSGANLYGQSPLEAGWKTLETDNEVVDTTKKQLTNQAARGLLVTKEMNGIGQDQAKELDLSLKAKMKDSKGGVAITNQPMEWINFGLSPADMELLQQGNATLKSLCNLYGVPPSLMGDGEGSTYNNVREAKSFLFQNAIIPEMVRLRDDLNKWLAPAYGEDIYIDFDFTVIPELQEAVSEMVTQMDKAWYVTPNEKRKVLYYPEDTTNPLMNEYFVPVNYMPMKNMDFQSLQSLESEEKRENKPNSNEQ